MHFPVQHVTVTTCVAIVAAFVMAAAVWFVWDSDAPTVSTTEHYIDDEEVTEDYDLYRQVIWAYNQVLDRNPSPTELNDKYRSMQAGSLSKVQLVRNLQATKEASLPIAERSTVSPVPRMIVSDDTIISLVREVFHRAPSEDELRYFREAYDALDRDNARMRTMLRSLPGAAPAQVAPPVPVAPPAPVVVVPPAPLISQILSRPDLLKHVADGMDDPHIDDPPKPSPSKNTDSCEVPKVSDVRNERNRDELGYACDRSQRDYSEVGWRPEDMVLDDSMRWAVPQPRPPVCVTTARTACEEKPMMTQSSLIGTLLGDAEDTQVGSILPRFRYMEKVK